MGVGLEGRLRPSGGVVLFVVSSLLRHRTSSTGKELAIIHYILITFVSEISYNSSWILLFTMKTMLICVSMLAMTIISVRLNDF